MSKCRVCESKGMFPFCPKCYLKHNGRSIVKETPKDRLETQLENIKRRTLEQQHKDLIQMKKAIEKINGDADGVDYLLENV